MEFGHSGCNRVKTLWSCASSECNRVKTVWSVGHSEVNGFKLYGVLAVLSVIGLKKPQEIMLLCLAYR